MSVSTFKRGLRISVAKHTKERTEGKAVELSPSPKQVVIPIQQHLGAPNQSLVKVGDKIKRGQIIADAVQPGPMTVPVHASISGVVKKIEPRTQSNNAVGMCIVIEGDTPYTQDTDCDFMPPLDPFTCTKAEALKRVRDAGIVGMGGAGFPTHVKLSPPPNKPIEYILANGAECEPYLTIDEALMHEKASLLVRGLAYVMKITGVSKAIIGMEDDKVAIVPDLEKEIRAAQDTYLKGVGSIQIGLCKMVYPQGGEKLLISALVGKEVPSGALPMDVGCIVQNVGTLVAIAEAFLLGKPLIDRDLTVSGNACKTPKNMRAPIGTLITDLPKEFIDVDNDKLRKIVFGGPMMGNAVHTAEIPIQKNTSGILFMTDKETFGEDEGPCIQCARCIKHCPCRLSPVIMCKALEAGDLDEAVKVGLMDCIECGSCTYICPARMRLVQRFRVGKGRLRAKQQAAAKK